MKRELAASFAAAVIVHALVLFVVRMDTEAVPLEVSDQPSTVDVSRVQAAPAAGAPSRAQPAPTAQQSQPQATPQPTPEPAPQPTPEPTPDVPAATPEPTATPPPIKSDLAEAESTPPKKRQRHVTGHHQQRVVTPLTQQVQTGEPEGAGGKAAATGSRSGAGPLNSSPRYRSNPRPAYPPEEMMQHHTGVVLVNAAVDEEGRVTGASLSRSSGFPALDQAALQAVRRWLFYPAHSGGLPVPDHVTVPVRFRLTD